MDHKVFHSVFRLTLLNMVSDTHGSPSPPNQGPHNTHWKASAIHKVLMGSSFYFSVTPTTLCTHFFSHFFQYWIMQHLSYAIEIQSFSLHHCNRSYYLCLAWMTLQARVGPGAAWVPQPTSAFCFSCPDPLTWLLAGNNHSSPSLLSFPYPQGCQALTCPLRGPRVGSHKPGMPPGGGHCLRPCPAPSRHGFSGAHKPQNQDEFPSSNFPFAHYHMYKCNITAHFFAAPKERIV